MSDDLLQIFIEFLGVKKFRLTLIYPELLDV